ncbi:hypothetical protein ASG92_04820 [Arthrobacter sp. Soil736]|uniref:hypothetical protein n=1 Tax=Arthrobacter sp. Soil736 TaxID=1736395 RepID=UPI0006FDEA38|nr:hypothetical protein [Arthrobacter sp. Soil736]KRE59173.1 hypothetical protein ASG92_04820 [Arthrobacter sp. Soil736]
MTAASYVPGGWLGLVRSGTAVILGPDTPAPLVSTVWGLLGDGPEVHDVLHAVTSGFGVPLNRTPWFGIIGFRESLRVFLRGDLDLTVHLSGGPVVLDGRNVTTWTERWLDAPEWFSLTVPGQSSALELPVTEGAVLLKTLRVEVAGGGSPAAKPQETEKPQETDSASEASADVVVEPVLEASAETVAGMSEETSAGMPGEGPDEGGLEETRLPETGLTVTGAADLADRHDEGPQVPAPATELTGSYDHLWDKTVMRSIEDAAVRDGQDDDGQDGEGHDDGGAPPAASQETGSQESAGPESASPESASHSTPGPDAHYPGTPARDAEPAEPGPANQTPVPGGLIDSVPWATSGDRAPRPQAPPSFISLSDARPGVDEQLPEQELPPQELQERLADGDHDGQTILKSDLSAAPQPASAPAAGREPGGGPLGGGPLVLARVCARGHANPPTSAQCPTCGSPLPDVAVQVPRPRLGRLRLSTGELIDLDESLVIGRQPSVSRVQGGVMPRLVQVASPGGDISRSHVEVRLEGWHVMLCDLKATNGTVLVREGQPPRRLAQNEMAIVLDGDIAELGDDVSLRFEEIL